MIKRVFLFVVTIGCFLGCWSCSTYRLGSGVSVPFSTLYIKPVQNQALVPQAQALLSGQLRDVFLREESVAVKDAGEAEATLTVDLVDYSRRVVAVQRYDTYLASDYVVCLKARVCLVDNKTQKPYFRDRVVEASINVYVGDGFPESEYQSMPQLTRELARKIKNAVVSVW